MDFSKIDPGKPESILKMTKKGKTLMMFVTVSGSPTEKETEEITSLWQGSLFNANYDVQRFIVGSDRAIFMLRDGGYAWEIKDFLVSQDRCADVTLEGQVYPGKGGGDKEKTEQSRTRGERRKKESRRPGPPRMTIEPGVRGRTCDRRRWRSVEQQAARGWAGAGSRYQPRPCRRGLPHAPGAVSVRSPPSRVRGTAVLRSHQRWIQDSR